MSQQLINRSPDLRRLLDEGYEVDVVHAHLVINNVPYVDSQRRIRSGQLVSTLHLAGDRTTRPGTHVAMFSGEYPCDANGAPLRHLAHTSERRILGPELIVEHSFSAKPAAGYSDYFEKMSTYAALLTTHAQQIDSSATAQTRRVLRPCDESSVFKYLDTSSAKAGIAGINQKLAFEKIAIVGLGGTGSFVLDFVAPTPVREIHLFDGDPFLQHNAFRMPGAASVEELSRGLKKVDFYAERYSALRHGVVPHPVEIDESNLHLLDGQDFVFICIDRNNPKRAIVERLEAADVPFIDVGLGVEIVDSKLIGIARVTTSARSRRHHPRNKSRINFHDLEQQGAYATNIQIVELNALNAALAVIKWKKLAGFYVDIEQEHSCAYTLDGNHIVNEDQAEPDEEE